MLIVTNTWNIVMAVFQVAQNVVSQSAGVIISDAGIDISGVVGDLETQLAAFGIGRYKMSRNTRAGGCACPRIILAISGKRQ